MAKGILLVMTISAGLFLFASIILWSPSKIAMGWSEIQIFLHMLYQTPSFISNTYPATITIGTLLSMTALSQRNELAPLQSAGVSPSYFLKILLLPILAFSVIGFFLIAYLAPIGNELSRNIGTQNKAKPSIWLKSKKSLIYINQIDDNQLGKIYVFQILKTGVEKFYLIKNEYHPSLKSFDIKTYIEPQITERKFQQLVTPNFIPSPHLLVMLTKSERRLTITQLYALMQLENKIGLDMKKIKFQFWRMISQPFITLLLLFTILPALFEAKKSDHLLKSTILGLAIILIFYLFNQIAWPITTLLNLPVFLAILMPPAIILISLKIYLFFNAS